MGYVGYSAPPVPDRGWEIPDRALASWSMLLPASSNMLQDPWEKNWLPSVCNTSTSGKAVPRRSLTGHSQNMQPHPMASQSSQNLPRSFTWLKAWAILEDTRRYHGNCRKSQNSHSWKAISMHLLWLFQQSKFTGIYEGQVFYNHYFLKKGMKSLFRFVKRKSGSPKVKL